MDQLPDAKGHGGEDGKEDDDDDGDDVVALHHGCWLCGLEGKGATPVLRLMFGFCMRGLSALMTMMMFFVLMPNTMVVVVVVVRLCCKWAVVDSRMIPKKITRFTILRKTIGMFESVDQKRYEMEC